MKREPIEPDREDIAAIEREQGSLPAGATDAEHAHRCRLAQAHKLLRLYEQGLLPVEPMRAIDALAAEKKSEKP